MKFGTYRRDADTGLDYAMNRYYLSNWGRFVTPDPYTNSAELENPQSWNHYGYASNNPINRFDPVGLCDQDPNYSVTVCGGEPDDLLTNLYPGDLYLLLKGPMGGYTGGQSGGGGASHNPNPSNWGLMSAAFNRAIQAITLNPKCFNLFGNAKTRQDEWNPTTVLTSLFTTRDGKYGAVDFNYKGNGEAVTTPTGSPLFPSIRNGLVGSSANISINANYWNMGNTAFNAETLLHELGHLYNFSRGSGGFALPNSAEIGDSQAFDKLIMKDCNLP